MRDIIGKKLLHARTNKVLPHIKGDALDIGCGFNVLMKQYREMSNHRGIGVDVYPWDGCDTVVENTAILPFPDQDFDTITCVAALNHIPNRDEVLKEMFRLLKPDGRILITMIPPTISTVWHRLRAPWDEDQHERGMKEGEVYGFTKQQMLEMFNAAGFELNALEAFMLGINKLYVFKKHRIQTSNSS